MREELENNSNDNDSRRRCVAKAVGVQKGCMRFDE